MEVSYLQKKKVLEAYFDRTAFAAWDRLTSELPVSWVREKCAKEGIIQKLRCCQFYLRT